MVAPPSQAIGTVIAEDTPQVVQSGQALMSWSDDHVTLDVRLVLPPGPGGLWLLPLPAGASSEVISRETLDTLAHWDTPTITVNSPPEDETGCGATSERTTVITAEGSRELPSEEGAFDEIGVLKTPSLTSLQEWLAEHDQSLPPSLESGLGPTLAGDKDLVWAAVAPGDSERFTPVLRVRFHQLPDAKQPLPLSLLGAEEQGRYDLLLHVLADTRYRVENYPSMEVSRLGLDLVEHALSDSPYQDTMDTVADEAGGSLVVVESAGTLSADGLLSDLLSDDATFLTRLHLR
ncbi:MAG: DUF2330 domain-containing protein, partial [Myxococcota bacterium]|nr:DUF2330 domain-containing protein [Myxococcota bacterium]